MEEAGNSHRLVAGRLAHALGGSPGQGHLKHLQIEVLGNVDDDAQYRRFPNACAAREYRELLGSRKKDCFALLSIQFKALGCFVFGNSPSQPVSSNLHVEEGELRWRLSGHHGSNTVGNS
ncbi:hypothetical protein SDC9_161411 [bioreactor metagenome]|uniref:Uncharacterized protein n=1 Tax=bioreactor metagenome TaxID=1076179 RepID=A0A645FI35_9ZZZZ